MPSVTPPREFVSAFRAFDASLRVRWGVRTQQWIIERKMPDRHAQLLRERPCPWKSPRSLDLYDGWREGYLHVLNVHPSLLDHRVFDTLRECDIWAQGTVEKMNKKLDEIQAQERAEADRHIANFNESASREAHDILQWRLGNRVAVTTPEPPLVDTGLGFKTRDTRRGRTTDPAES